MRKKGKKVIFFIFTLLPILTSCASGESSSSIVDKDDFIFKIIPNLWTFLAQLLSLIVIIIVFIIIGYKPVKKMLNKRKDHIEEEIKDAEKNKIDSETLLKQSENTLNKAKVEAEEIVTQAKKDAIKVADVIKETCDKECLEMKQKAKEDIEQSKEKAKDDIRKEIVDIALLASSEILTREVNKKDQAKFVDDFVKDIKKDK